MNKNLDQNVTVIGAAIIDIMASGSLTDKSLVETTNMDRISLSFGGDALNESVILSKLGVHVDLITVVGSDEAGEQVINFLKNNDIDVSKVIIEPDLRTGINIVLVDSEGERYFLSDSNSSLRNLNKEHIMSQIENASDYVCFASLFVSPLLKTKDMTEIFKQLNDCGKFILADMTRAKFGETAEELEPFLKYLNVLVGNVDEFELLTGTRDPKEIINKFSKLGSPCIVVKNGKHGSVLGVSNEIYEIPAYSTNKVVDTTGAGDSFAAGLMWGIINGLSMIEACRFASALASCTVEELGATNGFKSINEVVKRYKLLK